MSRRAASEENDENPSRRPRLEEFERGDEDINAELAEEPNAEVAEERMEQLIHHPIFSNPVISKEIFKYLSTQDLVRFCQVSKSMKSAASPYLCRYQISINISGYDSSSVKVKEVTGFPGTVENFTTDFPDLVARVFERSPLRFFIKLKAIEDNSMFTTPSEFHIPFLTHFGDRVESLDYKSVKPRVDFPRLSLLLSFLPNLEIFRGHEVELARRHDYGLGNPVTPVLPKLRSVQFRVQADLDMWSYILAIGTNLEEITGFPLEFSTLLRQFNRAGAVKSMVGFCPEGQWDLRQYEASLGILAGLNVQLHEMDIPNFYPYAGRTEAIPWNPKGKLAEQIKSHIWRIIDSSQNSLTHLTIPPAVKSDYYMRSDCILPAIEKLTFRDNPEFLMLSYIEVDGKYSDGVKPQYFPPGTILEVVTPKLNSIEIDFNHARENISLFFPRNIFGPRNLGPNITTLTINSFHSFKKLSLAFPYTNHLIIKSSIDHLEKVLPEIGEEWPRLPSLTVSIESSEGYHQAKQKGLYTLDSILTGIPKNVCSKLHRTIIWKKLISESEVEYYQRENFSLAKMSHLRQLGFIIKKSALRCKVCGKNHLQHMITPLGDRYGLRLAPGLELNVSSDEVVTRYGG